MRFRLKAAAVLLCGTVLLSAGCRSENNEQGTASEVLTETVLAENVYTETVYTETELTLRKNITDGQKLLPSAFYEEKNFGQHISAAKSYEAEKELICGVVPHHLTAGRLIASMLKTASESREKTDTVVVCATMHFGKSDFLTTSFSDWDTPFGILECDRELTELFCEQGAVTDDEMAALDHGINALIPYIKYYFPNSKIVYTLIDNRAEDDTAEVLTETLKRMGEEKECFYLFSADFSHYLEPQQTELHDRETLKAVMDRDIGKIAVMTDSNVDSPFVLGTFIRLSCELEREIQFFERSNSFLMSGIPYNKETYGEGLTSYFVFAA